MDRKDLELLMCLFERGRVDPVELAGSLSLTEANTNRRIRLMLHEGTIKGFSAFFDRRCMGCDTTYIRAHFPNRKRDVVLGAIKRLEGIASIYPNIDDFCMVEVVHEGKAPLQRTIDGIEDIMDTCTVSAVYLPRLPDEVPDLKDRAYLSLLRELVVDGLSSPTAISSKLKRKQDETELMFRELIERSNIRILPILSEEDVSPYPCFSFIATLDSPASLPEALSAINRIAPLVYDRTPLMRPPGLWMRSFGVDLHSMDHMLERIRRTSWVEDLTIILPEGVYVDRSVDLSLIDERLKR